MHKPFKKELPIRAKVAMARDVGRVMGFLHRGERASIDPLIQEMKVQASFLEEPIQRALLQFAEQVYFQLDYEGAHAVTQQVQRAADLLIESLGFSPPHTP